MNKISRLLDGVGIIRLGTQREWNLIGSNNGQGSRLRVRDRRYCADQSKIF